MADVRDWGAFVRGRWDWTRFGYEEDFPRGCQFTDIDSAIEFDGRSLVIEAKQYDGEGPVPPLPATGQLLALRDEVRRGKTVFVLYGCGVCNDPYELVILGTDHSGDRRSNWRAEAGEWLPRWMRRERLRHSINEAQGVQRSVDQYKRDLQPNGRLAALRSSALAEYDKPQPHRAACPCPACFQARLESWTTP